MEITNTQSTPFEAPEHQEPEDQEDLAKTSSPAREFFNDYGVPVAIFAINQLSPYRSLRCIANGIGHIREGNVILVSTDALELASCVWLPLRVGSLSIKGVYYLHQVTNSEGINSLPSSYKLVRVSESFFRLIPRLR